jgi:hypothetical protein
MEETTRRGRRALDRLIYILYTHVYGEKIGVRKSPTSAKGMFFIFIFYNENML